jgi:hypothetical protein
MCSLVIHRHLTRVAVFTILFLPLGSDPNGDERFIHQDGMARAWVPTSLEDTSIFAAANFAAFM